MQNLRLKEKRQRKALSTQMKKTTHNNIKEFFMNSGGILIKMLQVDLDKIRMNSNSYICADIYIFMSLYMWVCAAISGI